MPSFKDTTGQSWSLEISFGQYRRLKDVGFDLNMVGEASGQQLVAAIYGNPETLAETLWLLCKGQADEQKLTREQWEDRLTPDTIDKAADALWEAVADFIHRRRSPAVKAKLPALLKKMDAAIEKAAEAAVESALISSAGNSPA